MKTHLLPAALLIAMMSAIPLISAADDASEQAPPMTIQPSCPLCAARAAAQAAAAVLPAAPQTAGPPALPGARSLVIELRCAWQQTVTGSVAISACNPPACPTGWTDAGPVSCGANGIWCGTGCATVGDCSRWCLK